MKYLRINLVKYVIDQCAENSQTLLSEFKDQIVKQFTLFWVRRLSLVKKSVLLELPIDLMKSQSKSLHVLFKK